MVTAHLALKEGPFALGKQTSSQSANFKQQVLEFKLTVGGKKDDGDTTWIVLSLGHIFFRGNIWFTKIFGCLLRSSHYLKLQVLIEAVPSNSVKEAVKREVGRCFLSKWKGLRGVRAEGGRKRAQGTCCSYFTGERTGLEAAGRGFKAWPFHLFLNPEWRSPTCLCRTSVILVLNGLIYLKGIQMLLR